MDMFDDRKIYEKHKELSKSEKSDYISIAIDGSDMINYGLPFFSEITKDGQKGYKYPIKLVGVIVHSWGNMLYTFPPNIPKGGNSTIHVIHQTLSFVKDLYKLQYNKSLPKYAFFQVLIIIININYCITITIVIDG